MPLAELTVVSEQVAFGLQRPIAITGLPDGRMLIAEKNGTVRAYHPDTGLAAEPVLDLTARIDTSDNERGLLGITPAPNFARTGILYVAYTSLPAGALTLARVPIGAPERVQVLLTQEHAEYGNHNGGQVAFGRDGYLYWSLGDGGHANDPFKAGQNLGTLLGKIVRIDVNRTCGAKPYCVPSDNPFVRTPGARPEIWLYGLRNPWRFSVDPVDGSLWIGDVGQGLVEEINHIRPWQGGANLGWSCREGTPVFDPQQCRPGVRYTDPVFEYDHYNGELLGDRRRGVPRVPDPRGMGHLRRERLLLDPRVRRAPQAPGRLRVRHDRQLPHPADRDRHRRARRAVRAQRPPGMAEPGAVRAGPESRFDRHAASVGELATDMPGVRLVCREDGRQPAGHHLVRAQRL